MPFAAITLQTPYSCGGPTFVPSNDIFADQDNRALSAVVAAITGFSAAFASGDHQLLELQVLLKATTAKQGDDYGVELTPTLLLRDEGGDATEVSVVVTLFLTWDEPKTAKTTLLTAATEVLANVATTTAQSTGLSSPFQFLAAGLAGFDLKFSDSQEHALHSLRAYLGAAPVSGDRVAVEGSIAINDASQTSGIAGVTAAVAAIGDDGVVVFLQAERVVMDPTTGALKGWSTGWKGVPGKPGWAAVVVRGFTLSREQDGDINVASLAVGASVTAVTLDGDDLTVTADLTASAESGGQPALRYSDLSVLAIAVLTDPTRAAD